MQTSSPDNTANRALLPACPLCGSEQTTPYASAFAREYLACANCGLVSLLPQYRLSENEERTRYLYHQNSRDNAGYVAFLSQVVEVVRLGVPAGAKGLDYGCGPVPVLSELLTGTGRPTAYYDPLFHPEQTVLAERYDFVTCCEVVEHAFAPRTLFDRLARLLHRGSCLVVRTQLLDATRAFETWWYARDPTHVSFYSEQTLEWVAAAYHWRLAWPRPDVALFVSE